MKGREKREIPEKTRRPAASSDTIPSFKNPVTRPGIEPALCGWARELNRSIRSSTFQASVQPVRCSTAVDYNNGRCARACVCRWHGMLPKLTPSGYRVTVVRLSGEDSELDLAALGKRGLMVMDVCLRESRTLNNVIVFDLHGFTAAQMAKGVPSNPTMRRVLLCAQDAFPMRLAQLHFVNAPPLIEKLMAIAAPLLKAKLTKKVCVCRTMTLVGGVSSAISRSPFIPPLLHTRITSSSSALNEYVGVKVGRFVLVSIIHTVNFRRESISTCSNRYRGRTFYVHSQTETLYEYIPKDILPKEYGGNAVSMKEISDHWMKKLVKYRSWFQEEEVRSKADESKRPMKSNGFLSEMCVNDMQGSFRQLSID
ncbi:hypothetical protein PR048_030213 [Dryococelus australis]|uniref:CRAL-TRIO domain-containing protein n=1 Tax=Dryococelus australis TaxID=614101 RepID=A0ABQ9G8B2_9NEOP|nr:hypothetical protein PR048_030213 [Dryococelus australis]